MRTKAENYKQINKCASVVILILCLASPCLSADQEIWYHLREGQACVMEFLLTSKEIKEITIKSEKRLMIKFRTKATPEQLEKYSNKEPYPIKIEQTIPTLFGMGKETRSCSGIDNVGCGFIPVNGEIRLKISNNSTDNFRIVIIKEEWK